jgi:predicted neutral ceramidase superfamily lipid hydrolase
MNFVSLCLLLLPFGGALATRLLSRRWKMWLIWVAISVSMILLSLSLGSSLQEAGGLVIGASFFGFIAPEIWQGIKNLIVAVVSRPRNWVYAGGIVLLIYVFYHQEIIWGLMPLTVVLFVLLVIFRSFFPRR